MKRPIDFSYLIRASLNESYDEYSYNRILITMTWTALYYSSGLGPMLYGRHDSSDFFWRGVAF
jgi:hypothetical protein